MGGGFGGDAAHATSNIPSIATGQLRICTAHHIDSTI
jgi:hypothetical protein